MEEEEEDNELKEIGEKKIREGIKRDLEELSRETGISLQEYQGWTPPKAADSEIYIEELGINIPKGRLFHPSCGEDIRSFTMFREFSTGFDFADPFRMPQFDQKTRPRGGCKTIGKRYSPNVREGLRIGHIGTICPPTVLPEIDMSNPPHFIRRFYLDGVITFITHIHSMAIFYYTGDSPGEGGSNQVWLGQTLFPLVLDCLLDGGLIVTDGSDSGTGLSNLEYHSGLTFPWRPILRSEEKNVTFQFAGRKFQRFGCIWQVTRI
jgi:hypothetical protein